MSKTSEPILVYVTAAKKREAKKIATELLTKRLIACVNILQSKSMYRWKSKIVRSREFVLLMKTDKRHMSLITKEVKKMSSYDVPCIVEIPISGGSKEYLKWANVEVR